MHVEFLTGIQALLSEKTFGDELFLKLRLATQLEASSSQFRDR